MAALVDAGGKGNEVSIDTWGTRAYLVMEQNEALIEFLETANTDHILAAKFKAESVEDASLRFLRARQFLVPSAIELLQKCVERKTAGRAQHFAKLTAEECLKCDEEALKKFYPHSILGYDKFNRPVLYEWSGRINPAAITTMTTYASLIDYHFLTMERDLDEMFTKAKASSSSNSGEGAPISTCAVLDLEGLGLVHCTGAALDHVKALIALDNVCYPETLGKMFVINAPWLAVTTWEVVRGWLDPRTQAKIEILGSGADTTARLLAYIPAECLPVRYGGTAPDWVCARPMVEHRVIPRLSEVRRAVTVPAGHVLVVETYVPEGEVAVEVYVSPLQFPGDELAGAGAEGMSGKSTGSTDSSGEGGNSPADGGCAGVKLEDLVQLTKTSVVRPEGQSNPARDTQRFPNPGEAGMSFLVRWSNPAMLVGRSVVINVYTEADPSLLR